METYSYSPSGGIFDTVVRHNRGEYLAGRCDRCGKPIYRTSAVTVILWSCECFWYRERD